MIVIRTYEMKEDVPPPHTKGKTYVKVDYETGRATAFYPKFKQMCIKDTEYINTIEALDKKMKGFRLVKRAEEPL